MANPYKLLTPGNPKTMKGWAFGYMTYILHLAPADLSGWNVCPMATAGCKAACLNTAGRGGIARGGPLTLDILKASGRRHRTNAIQLKRIWRTKLYFEHRELFMAMLVEDIARAIDHARARDLVPVFRLNGTSDIRWERVPVILDGTAYPNIMSAFPHIQFYDYTKIANRRDLPANYALTFSLAENNDAAARRALAGGLNLAVVFRRKGELPESFMGRPVFCGDDSDLRFLDPAGHVIGLYAKGNARKDNSGFVR